MIAALVIVLALAGTSTAASLWVFLRRRVRRPQVLVFDARDTVIIAVAVVVVPLGYGRLPAWAVAVLLGVTFFVAVQFALEAVLGRGRAVTALALALCVADLAAMRVWGPASAGYDAVNDTLVVLVVVGVVNLWAQSGMRAQHLAVMSGLLGVYDVVATWVLPTMNRTILRLESIAYTPVIGWPISDGVQLSLGLGDLLIIALAPLVFLKAFGHSASVAVATAGLAVQVVSVYVVSQLGGAVSIPLMTFHAPVLIGLYLWARRRAPERTTAQFRGREPHPTSGAIALEPANFEGR